MGLIINSGSARSQAYAALKKAKQGDFVAAQELMSQSKLALNEAHRVQTQLIEGDQGQGNESEPGAGPCAGPSDDLNAGP